MRGILSVVLMSLVAVPAMASIGQPESEVAITNMMPPQYYIRKCVAEGHSLELCESLYQAKEFGAYQACVGDGGMESMCRDKSEARLETAMGLLDKFNKCRLMNIPVDSCLRSYELPPAL